MTEDEPMTADEAQLRSMRRLVQAHRRGRQVDDQVEATENARRANHFGEGYLLEMEKVR